ncbi:amidohydrolase family protein [Paenibacillus solisilvae]|uniref:Amidohydrolase family protein n=1 Tax=Paenibacillus solisilvae TaxID=2486751 RepID=A0ABW0VZK7_9BACL
MNYDIVIKNGLLIDGSGALGKKADIGIVGDVIMAIGDLQGADAERILDANGMVVCPGFIDVHVHSELALLGGPDKYAPLKMGVTTQLASPDGFSWAPLQRNLLKEMKDYLNVFYDDECIDISKDLTLERFLSLFKGNIPSNIVLQVPHASVRLAAMGWKDSWATDDEIKVMEKITREWMEMGAKAFATGLEYEPMRRSDLRELVALSKVVSEYGGIYVAHQRGYGNNVHLGCKETFSIGRLAEIPVHISHLAIDPLAAEQVDYGVKQGVDITFEMYPYPAGCTHLLLYLPEDAQVGSPEDVKERLKDRAFREKISVQVEKAFNPIKNVRFASVRTPQPMGWEGKSLDTVQEELGLNLTDTVCDIILMSGFRALAIYHWEDKLHPYLEATYKHPLHMVGTDGIYIGNRPHPRGYGSYPKILGEYVRDNKWLTLEQAIYKMSGFPAKRFNIKSRGILMEGNYADIVVFDPSEIEGTATFEQPRSEPKGIHHVMVNGHFVISDGIVKDGNYGRIL